MTGLTATLGGSLFLMLMAGCNGTATGDCPGGRCSADAGPGTDVSPDRGASVTPDGAPDCGPGVLPCSGTCCAAGEICQSGKCVSLGPSCDELHPCPEGQACDKSLGRCIPGASTCEYRPPTGVFTPKLKWEWTGSVVAPAYNQVMMAPMVANLTDDNKDGKIDRNDIPDIVFNTYAGSAYTKDGVLRAISGDGSGEIFSITDPQHRTTPSSQVALADIDGDHRVEIVTCADSGGVIAFEDDGAFKWKTTGVSCKAPAIADLDGDGTAEVVVCYAALEGATGVVRWNSGVTCASYTTVADIDEDGRPEVVGGNRVFTHDGKVRWEDTTRPDGYVAVADLDGDGKPEVITTSASDHALRAHHHDGTAYFGPVDINQGHADLGDKCAGCGGGPPTVADFDGDGKPEIAAAAGYGYVLFEHDGKPKWFQSTQDLSSRTTGSAVFDFEGDGKAEVVYGDELLLRVYDGQTGKTLFSTCNTSGTLQEYPVIVDVDNDGHAEIVVANNNYAFKTCSDGSPSSTGIRVLADTQGNWVRTRRIWNQHTYHVTNVDEDGQVPKVEERNWDNPALNNFRQNVQPGGLFDAPDLAGGPGQASCGSFIRVTAEVTNRGAAKTMPGVKVTLYADRPAGRLALQTLATTSVLYPGQTETLSFSVMTPAEFDNQSVTFFVVVDDDGQGHGSVNECKEDNNKAEFETADCKLLE